MIQHPRPFDGISKDYSCWYWYLSRWTEQFLEQIVQINVIFISKKSIIKKIKEWYHVSLTSNISAKTWSGIGGVLKTSGPADFKSNPGFENWPRFVGVLEQNKILNSLSQYCIHIMDISFLYHEIHDITYTYSCFKEIILNEK